MDDITEALESLARRNALPTPKLDEVKGSRHRDGDVGPRWRTRRSISLTLSMVIALGTFGLGVAAANVSDSIGVTHRRGEAVPMSTSANCDVLRSELVISTQSGSPGSIVGISGPLYHLDADNEVLVPGNEAVQAWWNLDPTDYSKVAPTAVEAANGADVFSAAGAEMLGDFSVNGGCSFDLEFAVPDVPAGEYPVSIVRVAGSDGSTTVYGSFLFSVP